MCKTCSICRKEKSLDKFYSGEKRCKECISVIRKEWRKNNAEKDRLKSKEYYANNKDKVKKSKEEYRANNKDKIKLWAKNWLDENYEKHKGSVKKYYLKNRDRCIAINSLNKIGITEELRTDELITVKISVQKIRRIIYNKPN